MNDTPSLLEDIERIAKLRGIPVEEARALLTGSAVTEQKRKEDLDARRRRDAIAKLTTVWTTLYTRQHDQRVYDRLPAKSRDFISRSFYELCAIHWERALSAFDGDEDALIAAYTDHLLSRGAQKVVNDDPPCRSKKAHRVRWSPRIFRSSSIPVVSRTRPSRSL